MHVPLWAQMLDPKNYRNWPYANFSFSKSDVLVPILHTVWILRNMKFAVQHSFPYFDERKLLYQLLFWEPQWKSKCGQQYDTKLCTLLTSAGSRKNWQNLCRTWTIRLTKLCIEVWSKITLLVPTFWWLRQLIRRMEIQHVCADLR